MPELTDAQIDTWMANFVAFQRCLQFAEAILSGTLKTTQLVRGADASPVSMTDWLADFSLCGAHVLAREEYTVFVALIEGRLQTRDLPDHVSELFHQRIGAEVIRKGLNSRRYFDATTKDNQIGEQERKKKQRLAVFGYRNMLRRLKIADEEIETDEAA